MSSKNEPITKQILDEAVDAILMGMDGLHKESIDDRNRLHKESKKYTDKKFVDMKKYVDKNFKEVRAEIRLNREEIKQNRRFIRGIAVDTPTKKEFEDLEEKVSKNRASMLN